MIRLSMRYNRDMIEIQRCNNKDTWDNFVLEAGCHPLQLWSWGQVKSMHGWRAERLFAYDGEVIVGAAQVLVRKLPLPFRSFAYIPRGPIFKGHDDGNGGDGDSGAGDGDGAGVGMFKPSFGIDPSSVVSDFLNALADFSKREYHSVALSIEPELLEFEKPDGWVHSTNKVMPAETILLDISRSESDLLADMAKKTRQYIRKSSADVSIKQVKSRDELEVCYEIYKQTADRAGFNLHNFQYYLDVFTQMGDFAPIFVAYEGDQVVAFLWLAISEATVFELYGGMSNRGQELRANYGLKWHAIRKVKEWGIDRYDFGGLVAGGVSTFKQQWSSGVTVYAGTFDRPLSPLYILWSRGLPLAKRVLQSVRRGSRRG